MTWRPANSLVILREAFNQSYPQRSKADDGTIASDAHRAANPASDHEVNEHGVVCALDITHDPAHGVDTYRIADYMRLHHDFRLHYIISDRRIAGDAAFVKKNPHYNCPGPWMWGTYDGKNPHDEHVHFSVLQDPAVYDSLAPWDIGSIVSNVVDTPPRMDQPATLRLGSKGEGVKILQGLLGIDTDGEFGPKTQAAVQAYQRSHSLVADGVAGPYTWRSLQAIPITPPGPPVPPGRIPLQSNITASVFGGTLDSGLSNNFSAYTGKALTSGDHYVALPYRFKGVRPTILVTNPKSGKSVVCTVQDIGPWNTNDPYWKTLSRPQAETGIDMTGRHTNRAGIDISMAAAKAIGIDGMGTVNWVEVQS